MICSSSLASGSDSELYSCKKLLPSRSTSLVKYRGPIIRDALFARPHSGLSSAQFFPFFSKSLFNPSGEEAFKLNLDALFSCALYCADFNQEMISSGKS